MSEDNTSLKRDKRNGNASIPRLCTGLFALYWVLIVAFYFLAGELVPSLLFIVAVWLRVRSGKRNYVVYALVAVKNTVSSLGSWWRGIFMPSTSDLC